MKVIYVAGPFRGKSSWEIQCNIMRAMELALEVWRTGKAAVICPHANTMFYQGAAPDNYWLDGDLELVKRSDAVLVTPDWYRSVGARAEVEFANQHSIPVFYETSKVLEWIKNDSN